MTLTKGMIRNAAVTPLDARLMDMAKVVNNADNTPRVGVFDRFTAYTTPAALVQTTAGWNYVVNQATFATSKGIADGVAIFSNDGPVNVGTPPAPVSNSRIDVIYVKHNDNTTGDANSNPIFGVVNGTAAASPTKPAIPTGALELATCRVYAGTTGTSIGSNLLTQTYQQTAMKGGVVNCRSIAERDAWSAMPASKPNAGQLVEVGTDYPSTYRWQEGAPGSWEYVGYSRGVAVGRSSITAANNTARVCTFATSQQTMGPLAYGETADSFTVKNSGVFRVCAYVTIEGNVTGARNIGIAVNGVQSGDGTQRQVPSTASTYYAYVEAILTLSNADTLSVLITQNSGVSLSLTDRWFTVERLF